MNKEVPQATELFKTDKNWITVKRAANSNFCYTERRGIDSVSIVLIDVNNAGLGLIRETKPPFNEREREADMHFKETALGGSLFDAEHTDEEWLAMSFDEQKAIATKVALQELKEEAGYTIKEENMVFCKRVVFNSMSNEYVWLFVAEVDKEKDLGERDPQTAGEARASLQWLSSKESFDVLEDGKTLATLAVYSVIKQG